MMVAPGKRHTTHTGAPDGGSHHRRPPRVRPMTCPQCRHDRIVATGETANTQAGTYEWHRCRACYHTFPIKEPNDG